MNTSSTRLKKIWQIWLVRIIGFGLVFVYAWVNILVINQYYLTMKDGAILDIVTEPDNNGNTIVTYISSEGAAKGITIGDQLLNVNAITNGEIGTEAILQFQRGNLIIPNVHLERKPNDYVSYGGMLLGLPANTSVSIALFLAGLPVLISVLSALLLCWLRSDDWMALLTAVVIIGLYDPPSQKQWIDIFTTIVGLALYFWLVLFPNGKLMSKWLWIPILFTSINNLYSLFLRLNVNLTNDLKYVKTLIDILYYISILVILTIMIYRYRLLFSSVERQQSKWIFIILIVGMPPFLLTKILYNYIPGSQFDLAVKAYLVNVAVWSLVVPVLILGILFSIFKYRLYDVDFFVSQALVYSSLTGILGIIGTIIITLLQSIPKNIFGDQSRAINLVISALPIAALFNPVRVGLQQVVDRYFKPEDIDFENAFIEFSPELSSFFSIEELSTLLADQAVQQLAVSHASVFLSRQSGDLNHIKTTSIKMDISKTALDQETIETIKKGQLAIPDGDSALSLVIPLVVPRALKPSLLGALMLGPRIQGLGYSTEMQKSLKKFGEVAGKAFYIAELKDRKKFTS